MDSVDEIKSRLDVVDIIGEYLPLKPAGSGSFKTNCPFHQEKTPSFFVNRPRQSWHCFGCNIGGDIITFIEKIEGMEFIEALELLAQKAGVPMPQFDKKTMGVKKHLQEVNEYICKLLRHNLTSSEEAKTAREYVEKRGIDDITADLWKIGYAPQDWNELSQKIKSQGYNASDLIQAGIANAKEHGDGIYFRFRGRLMFPINDAFGHVIGFTGRIMGDEKVAKYINTPETSLYKKSNVLYGLDKAKAEIKMQDLAIIVEGNMDALTSHQFGVQNVVASSGTALTVEQLSLLKRFTKNLAFAFDRDAAGLTATLRGLDLARQMDFSIRMISYDANIAKDPDELIRKNIEYWKDAIRNARPLMDWIYGLAFEQNSSSTPEGKKKIAQFVLNECRHIQHPVERDAWLNRLAKDLDVSVDALRASFKIANKQANSINKFSHQKPQNTQNPVKKPLEQDDNTKQLEERWLSTLICNENLFVPVEFEWTNPPHAKLYKLLLQRYNSRIKNNITDIEPLSSDDQEITKLINYLSIYADKEFESQAKEDLKRELAISQQRLIQQYASRRMQQLEQQMRQAERLGDTEQIKQLLEQISKLNS